MRYGRIGWYFQGGALRTATLQHVIGRGTPRRLTAWEFFGALPAMHEAAPDRPAGHAATRSACHTAWHAGAASTLRPNQEIASDACSVVSKRASS